MNYFLLLTLASFSATAAFADVKQPNQAAANNNTSSARLSTSQEKTNEKYEILKRDQIDPTDIYEIPFGDSEVEDEEEINRDEKKDVFPLPHSR